MKQIDLIKDYYGQVLTSKRDLKTSACCAAESIPSYLKGIVAKIHEEVSAKFYGCGVPIPPCLSGATVLDLGCGSGRDCFVLSSLVGEHGMVIGIDMTKEQLEVALKHSFYHQHAFGLSSKNVEFRQGYIEDLQAVAIADDSIDVVVSNCVINLSPDKERVFKEIFRVLKPGGELYFSDVFCDRRLPESFRQDPVLLGECLGGALYIEDFRRLLARQGCYDYRLVGRTPIDISNDDIRAKTGNARFYSMTIRAFKLPLEDRCEDYGQIATYLGSLEFHPHGFLLDDHHFFATGKPMPVCANTAAMLSASRYRPHFDILGQTTVHFGLFDCSFAAAAAPGEQTAPGACC